MKRTMSAFAILAGLTMTTVLVAQSPAPPQGPPEGPAWAMENPEAQFRGPMQRGRGFGPGPGMGMRRGMRGFGPGGGLMGLGPEIQERLGLTPEQVKQLEQRRSEFAKSQIRSQADLRVKEMELGELLRADKADRVAIERKLKEVGDAQFAARKAGIDHMLGTRELLTPEQREKLRTLPQQLRRERMQQGDGPGFGPGRRRLGPEGPMGPRPPQPPQPPQPPAEPQ